MFLVVRTLFFLLSSVVVVLASVVKNGDATEVRGLAHLFGYEPYPNGTPVRHEFSDGWYFGNITSFDEATMEYTVLWSDGDVETYSQPEEMDIKVNAAGENYEPYPNATKVLKFDEDDYSIWGEIGPYNSETRSYMIKFDDSDTYEEYTNLWVIDQYATNVNDYEPYDIGTAVRYEYSDGWYFGEIQSYDEDTMSYTILWSDGDVGEYYNLAHMDDKVSAAGENYVPYANATRVSKELEDGSYVWGEIGTFDSDTRTYMIKFDDKDEYEAYSDLSLVDQFVTSVNDYEPYENGTLVRYQYSDGWYFGTIISYDETLMEYSVEWTDGEIRQYDNLAHMDDKVSAAGDNYQPHSVGTQVRKDFRDSDQWYFGTIKSYDDDSRTYQVEWSDGDILSYSDLPEMDTMVLAVVDYQPYEPGTAVRHQFDPEVGHLFGTITKFDEDNLIYTTEWSDGSVVTIDNLSDADEMVNSAKSHTPFAIGQEVKSYDEDTNEYWWGEITAYDEDTKGYTVSFTDGSKVQYADGAEVEEMVQAARLFDEYPEGTQIRKKFDDSDEWFFGTIQYYSKIDRGYSVLWIDGMIDTLRDEDEVDECVANAYDNYVPYSDGFYVFDGVWGELQSFDEETMSYYVVWDDGETETLSNLAQVDSYVNAAYDEEEIEEDEDDETQDDDEDKEVDNNDEDDGGDVTLPNKAVSGEDSGLGGGVITMVVVACLGVTMLIYQWKALRRRKKASIENLQRATEAEEHFSDNLRFQDAAIPSPPTMTAVEAEADQDVIVGELL